MRGPIYLAKDHGRDLLRGEGLLLAEVLDLDFGLVVTLLHNLERPGLDVLLHGGVVESASNETPVDGSEYVPL